MQKILSLVYKLGYPIMKTVWFFTRPKTTGVRCIIKNRDSVLLIKHTYGNSLWTTAGGGVENNESKETAVIREVQEEVSLEISNLKYCGKIFYNGEYKKDTIHVFVSEVENINYTLQYAEIKEASWFPNAELPADISPLFMQMLNLCEDELIKTTKIPD